MHEFVGRILAVDLTTRKVEHDKVARQTVDSYIGGRGLGARLLMDLLPPNADPLGPETPVIFVTGPLTGSPFPGSGKFVVISKSPATGGFVDAHSSGFFAPALRLCGIDILVVKGKASEPSYLWIEDGRVGIQPAIDLWGMDAFEAESHLRARHGSYQTGVIVIGPAGENLVKFASLGSDYYRHAARGGIGAVMGSKLLKAILVHGSGFIAMADPQQVIALQREQVEKVKKSPLAQARIKYGTPSTFTIVNAAGMLPTSNFRRGTFPDAIDKLDGEGVLAVTTGRAGCYGCIMPCSRLTEARKGKKRVRIEGPEHETLAMLGSNLGIADIAAVLEGNLRCDQLGMDTISAGGVIAFAMECVERGLLKDPSLQNLRFGNEEAAIRLLEKIAYRDGIGDLMAEGVRSMAAWIGGGSERFAMHVKGLELPAYDPRAGFGTGLTYAVTPRGGCHRRAWPPAKEVLGKVPPFTIQGKAAMVKDMFDERAVLHSLVACDFHPGTIPISMEEYLQFVNAVTGQVFTLQDCVMAAERIETTIRLLNIREGLTRQDDTLPKRILEEPLPDGPAKGQLFGQEGLDTMLQEYYALRGWDEQGVPLPETLQRLGIEL